MRLVVGDSWTYLYNAEGCFGLIDSVTSYRAKGRFFAPAFKSGMWDGIKRLREYDRSKKLYRIPTGLLSRVLEVLDAAGHCYVLEDNRCLEVPDPIFSFQDGSSLRDYQARALEAAITCGRGTIKAVTGAGKTVLAAALINSYAQVPDFGNTIWLTDRINLMYQSQKRLEGLLGCSVGLLGDGNEQIEKITVCMVPTFLARVEQLQDYIDRTTLLILDEAHHAQADSWYSVIQAIPAPYRFAVSATPCFGADGMRLLGVAGDIITEITARQLIDAGYLIDPDVYFVKYDSPTIERSADYRAVRKRGILENQSRNEKVLDVAWTWALEKRPALTLIKEISHGKLLTYQLRKAGIKTEYIQGITTTPVRDQILNGLATGELDHVVASIQIIGEGTDLPFLRGLINATGARGGGSKASSADDEVGRATIQAIGRLLRICPGKTDAAYVDFYDDAHRFLKEATKNRVAALEEEGFTKIKFWGEQDASSMGS